MADQADLNGLTLYQMEYCPYCVYVRDVMRDMGLTLPIKDIVQDAQARDELIAGGGKGQVPCLRIEQDGQTHWLYESQDIVRFLGQRVG